MKVECDMVLPISSSFSTEIEEKDDIILNARPIDSKRRSIWTTIGLMKIKGAF